MILCDTVSDAKFVMLHLAVSFTDEHHVNVSRAQINTQEHDAHANKYFVPLIALLGNADNRKS